MTKPSEAIEDSQVDRAQMRIMIERLQMDSQEHKAGVAAILEKLAELKDGVLARLGEMALRVSSVEARVKLLEDAHREGAEGRKRFAAMVMNHGLTLVTTLGVGWLALKGGCK